jgi:phosphoribosylaminoimidazole-succinocarboxamide synthase
MAKLSPIRAEMPILEGLGTPHRGKVRDTYQLGSGLLLPVATDAISIFDFVLNAKVARKGMMLTVMSHFFARYLQSLDFPTHLVAAGSAIDRYLPKALQGNPQLQARAMVVQRLDMYAVELVTRRHFLASSTAFRGYDRERGGSICGHRLPKGLQDGDELPEILDTPTTKAEDGPDMPMDHQQVRRMCPGISETCMYAFRAVSAFTEERGIRLADTKMEAGVNSLSGEKCIGDELFTPDSSRFWDLREWREAQAQPIRKAPASYDKQFVRAEGIRLGIDKLSPKDPDHIARVHGMQISDGILEKTTDIYREICVRLLGRTPEHYLEHELGVEGYV